ncbi:MAG: ABC transporter permease [Gemmatimonadales bacterium]
MIATRLRQLLIHPSARVGLALVSVLALAALLAPVLAPYDPAIQLDLEHGQLQRPSLAHPLGTDFFSRDLLSRVLYGARISLVIAAFAVALSLTIGTAVGLLAGLAGGIVDTVLMRIVDAVLAIPRVFLLLTVVALWDRVGVTGLVLVLGLTSWFDTSRLVRAEVLSLRSRAFITATTALGFGRLRTALRHVLPNALAPILVSATLGMGQIVLVEAGLSYLGVGVPPPVPSWGRMIADGQTWLTQAWWVAAFPGLAVVLTVLGFSLLSDGLRDTLDPRSQ